MFSFFDVVAVLLTLTAAFAWVNHRLLGLPSSIGLMVMGFVSSVLVLAFDILFPEQQLSASLIGVVQQFDFSQALLNGMLAFLLFAGSLHVDLGLLRERALVVSAMAVVATLLSTAIVGVGIWLVAQLAHVSLPLAWALVFGALISPTDPVAVQSTLKMVGMRRTLNLDMTGESLFNDGVGVVVFTVMVSIVAGSGEDLTALGIVRFFLTEAVGGVALGILTGYVAYRATRAVDDYVIEILISLALAAGTYSLAGVLHTSGPLAVVAAGLFIGNKGPRDGMSEETQRYLFGLWTVIDETLNAMLFLLIGLEVLLLRFDLSLVWFGLLAIPLVLLARLISVTVPHALLRPWWEFAPGTIAVLTWGGLRGGISIALALPLPQSSERAVILAMTYAVVTFAIVVQGLTLGPLIRRFPQTVEASSGALPPAHDVSAEGRNSG
jgi:Na+:H+ antiporter